jgi:hypothetical protein
MYKVLLNIIKSPYFGTVGILSLREYNHPSVSMGIDSRTSKDTKILRCSGALYKNGAVFTNNLCTLPHILEIISRLPITNTK